MKKTFLMRQQMDITRTRVLFVFLFIDVIRFQEVVQCFFFADQKSGIIQKHISMCIKMGQLCLYDWLQIIQMNNNLKNK